MSMLDKTRLEHDIESREVPRTPAGVRIFIALLLIAICVMGAYIYSLKRDIRGKEEEIVKIKDEFKKESNRLLSKIKKHEDQSPDLSSGN
jgi:Tfp pilus assembly protein PilO